MFMYRNASNTIFILSHFEIFVNTPRQNEKDLYFSIKVFFVYSPAPLIASRILKRR